MRYFVGFALLVTVMVTAVFIARQYESRSQAPASPVKAKAGYPAFAQALEREIRKLDRWVEEEVEQDYSGAPKRRVKLQLLKKADLALMRKEGFFTFVLAYRPHDDVLIIPYPSDVGALGSISHELWHALYDCNGKVGLIRRSDGLYVGPSPEEIATYTRKKVGSPEFRTMAEKLAAIQMAVPCVQAFEKLRGKCQRFLKAAKRLQELELRCNSAKEFESYLAHGESCEAFQRAVLQSKAELRKFGGNVKRIITLRNEIEAMKNRQVFASELAALAKALVAEDEALRELRPVLKSVQLVCRKVTLALDEAEKKLLANDLRDADPETLKAMREADAAMSSFGDLATIEDSLEDFDGVLGTVFADLKAMANEDAVKKIFGEPNEVMGRVVKSLYSLYYGPVEQNKFPLTEEDLRFLERFMWKGTKLFRKGIERYRLGLAMIRDGAKPTEVKRILEYATEFAYKGVAYHWPEADFRIKGIIPLQAPPKLPLPK